ncbi:hypothetical protein [Mucilaginibacter sp. 22184]|uniref:hypothetical protein n=1 Tax=Mucilaginibacter sp. 22184 TaxID=3453887 RepID=UPI003F85A2C7
MTCENGKFRRVNPGLTDMIIKLHELGYTEDFAVTNRCHGDHYGPMKDLLYSEYKIKVVSQYYDQLLKKFIYLHTAETVAGERGIVVTDSILTGNQDIIIHPAWSGPPMTSSFVNISNNKTILKTQLI